MSEHYVWVEKFRPRVVEDCILPKATKASIKSLVAQGNIPNLLLNGPPGMGKTTLALALCQELNWEPLIINGSEERGIDTFRFKIKNFASSLSLDGRRRCVIIDEADYLTPDAQAASRSLIEEFAINCSFIFTCNNSTKLIPALHSRCSTINFAIPPAERSRLMAAVFERLKFILTEEKVTFDENIVVALIKRWWPDVRRTINEMQRGCVDGALSPSVLGQHNDANYADLWLALQAKDFTAVRKWVGENEYLDAPRFYRAVFEWCCDFLTPQTLPAAVIIIADYQYRNLFAVDPQVHMSAFCAELMMSTAVK